MAEFNRFVWAPIQGSTYTRGQEFEAETHSAEVTLFMKGSKGGFGKGKSKKGMAAGPAVVLGGKKGLK